MQRLLTWLGIGVLLGRRLGRFPETMVFVASEALAGARFKRGLDRACRGVARTSAASALGLLWGAIAAKRRRCPISVPMAVNRCRSAPAAGVDWRPFGNYLVAYTLPR